MPRSSLFLAIVLTNSCLWSAALATTLTVRQDGTGDYTTLTAAIAASFPADTIEVGPGVYSEPPLTVTHSLYLVSTDGPDLTVLDGQNTQRILAFTGSSNSSEVLGVQFRNGNSPGIGSLSVVTNATAAVRGCLFTGNEWSALSVHSGGTAIVEECIFESNISTGTPPGAIYASGSGAQLLLSDCDFTNNQTPTNGGAVSVVLGAFASIAGSRFEGNFAATHGAAVHVASNSEAEIESSVFVDNIAAESSAIYFVDSTGSVTNSTFVRNRCSNYQRGSLVLHVANTVEVWNNIFYGELNGPGIFYIGASGVHECNLFWDNLTGPIFGDTLSLSDSEQDPIFCDTVGGNFSVSTNGPAAPANNSCGVVIGALAPACVITIVPPTPGASYVLGQNIPNPFNPSTTIPILLGSSGRGVTLRIYDSAGREVTTLLDGIPPSGLRSVRWDGRDKYGHRVASGTYYYQLLAPDFTAQRKMVLVR
jgi:hypothetical protein